MKKTLMLALALPFLNCAYADIIELDTGNVQNCIQQLSQSKEHIPIILEYMENCPFYHKFLPVYEAAATSHSDLSFYKVDITKLGNDVKDQCLGEGSAYAFVSPKVTVNNFISGSPTRIIPLRSDVGSLRAPFSADDLNYLLRNLGASVSSTSLPNHTIFFSSSHQSF